MKQKLLKRNEQTGFTIIEVVLVLAIAGLIFLIVFLALPQLQRSRRDTQRKNDAGRAISALESRAGNTSGQYPNDNTTDWNAFVGDYLTNDGDFGDPETGDYTWVTGTPANAGEIRYHDFAICDANGDMDVNTTNNNERNIAVEVYQESGGSYCQDNR